MRKAFHIALFQKLLLRCIRGMFQSDRYPDGRVGKRIRKLCGDRILPGRLLCGPLAGQTTADPVSGIHRCHGTDPDVDLCHHDFHFHCSGKGNRHHGNSACITSKTVIGDFVEGCSLFPAFDHQSDNDLTFIPFRTPCTDCRKFTRITCGLVTLYSCFTYIGTIDLLRHRKASSRTAHLRYAADDSYYPAIWYDFHHRKHAAHFTVPVQPNSSSLVHRTGP